MANVKAAKPYLIHEARTIHHMKTCVRGGLEVHNVGCILDIETVLRLVC